MSTAHTKAILLSLATAATSGIAIFINKFAVGIFSPPLIFTALKNTGVAFIIIAILVVSQKWRLLKVLNRAQITQLLAIGVIGGALPFYLFFTGLSMIPALNAALIHKSLVLWVALLAIPLLKEKLSNLQVTAILLLFASNFIFGAFQGFQFSTGEFMVIAATILWAVENVIAKKILKNTDPDLVVAARMGIGAAILLTASAVFYPDHLTQLAIPTVTQTFWLLATMTTLLIYVMTWYRALKLAPVTFVATILVSATLVTNLLSAVFITHTFTFNNLIETGIIISLVSLFLWEFNIVQKTTFARKNI